MEPLTDRAVCLPECVCGGPRVECVQPARARVTRRGERRSRGRKSLVRRGFASAGLGLLGPAPSLRPTASTEEAHSLHGPPWVLPDRDDAGETSGESAEQGSGEPARAGGRLRPPGGAPELEKAPRVRARFWSLASQILTPGKGRVRLRGGLSAPPPTPLLQTVQLIRRLFTRGPLGGRRGRGPPRAELHPRAAGLRETRVVHRGDWRSRGGRGSHRPTGGRAAWGGCP